MLELLIVVTSLVAAGGLQSMGSVIVARGLTCPKTCGIFSDRGLNLCPLHWQADSLPLDHQRSPRDPDFNSSGYIWRSRIAGSYENSIFNFLGDYHTFSIVAAAFYVLARSCLQQHAGVPVFEIPVILRLKCAL